MALFSIYFLVLGCFSSLVSKICVDVGVDVGVHMHAMTLQDVLLATKYIVQLVVTD